MQKMTIVSPIIMEMISRRAEGTVLSVTDRGKQKAGKSLLPRSVNFFPLIRLSIKKENIV